MSTYEYTDICGDKLEVEHRPVTGMVMVSAYTRNEADDLVQVHVNVDPHDAPAVALAILEAAGMAEDPWSETCAAVKALQRHEKVRAEKAAERAEREAEDAAAKDYLKATNRVSLGDRWDLLTPGMQETYRFERRAAQDYFRKIDAEIVPAEIVEPRVLQHGDTCQDLDAKWRTQQGYSVEYDPTYAQWEITAHVGPVIRAKTIDRFSTAYFPMTEVL